MGEMIIPGDIILDAAGAIGIVINICNGELSYKTIAHDGLEMLQDASVGMVTPLGAEFKKNYLKEIRKLKRRNDALLNKS